MCSKIEEVAIEMPWGRLALKCWNPNHLPPVLVIHGVKANAASFDFLIPLLSPEYHYVCVDLPGHGLSSHISPGLPESFITYVTVIQRLIRCLKWKSFGLMGHSQGGLISIFVASAEYRTVNKLILIEPAIRYDLEKEIFLTRITAELEQLLEIEQKFSRNNIIPSIEDYEKKMMTSSFPLVEEAAKVIAARNVVKVGQNFYSTTDPKIGFQLIPHLTKEVHEEIVNGLQCPILIVMGSNSRLYQTLMKTSFQLGIFNKSLKRHPLSRSELLIGDHCVHSNNPKIVAPHINKFLKEFETSQSKL